MGRALPLQLPPPADSGSNLVTVAEIVAFAGRHPLLSLALIAITLALIGVEVVSRLSGIRRIGPSLLVGLMNRENALVVDLRTPVEFEKGHIAGAKNVQLTQFDPENKQLAPAKALPVVLVCQSGQTAHGAASRLRKAGFTHVSVLDGGIQAWRGADLPLVKGR